MNDPTIVEERGPERDLVYEGFDRLLDCGLFFVKHGLKVGSNDLQHQHVVFSICSLHLEMVQESEDAIRSRMCRRPGGEMMVNLDLVPAGKFSYGKLEGDISAAQQRYC